MTLPGGCGSPLSCLPRYQLVDARVLCLRRSASPRQASPFDAAIATRLVPLYYMRDAEKVIAMVRGPAVSAVRGPAMVRTDVDPLQTLKAEQRLLQSQRAGLLANRATQPAPPAQQPTSLAGGFLETAGRGGDATTGGRPGTGENRT